MKMHMNVMCTYKSDSLASNEIAQHIHVLHKTDVVSPHQKHLAQELLTIHNLFLSNNDIGVLH